MFFIDKYLPESVEKSYFHKDEFEKLKIIADDESIPHIIFYGPEGCGKKTMINLFLEMIYDKSVHKLTNSVYTVTGSGNSSTQVNIKQSNYHIVIEPNNNNFDRYLIQDVVKDYAKRVPLGVFSSKKTFKTVLINNIDNLSYYAQTSLRRTMEKYSDTCRFIMWSRSLTKVIDPLISRCYCFRVKSPSSESLLQLLLNVSANENIKLDFTDYEQILESTNGNIKKALWCLELRSFDESYVTTYETIIDRIINLIISTQLKHLIEIRELLYKIMITNISGSKIIKDIVNKLLNNSKICEQSKITIVELAAEYEYNLVLGRREIIHLEAFITGTMKTLFTDKKKLAIKS